MGDRREGPPIVVADDDPTVRRMLLRVLAHEGYPAVAAEDGEGALALCREHHPRLVLLDRAMPPPLYFEIAETLRSELGPAAPRIVVMTGSPEVTLPETVDAVLPKPFTLEALYALLERFEERGPAT